MIAFRTAVAGDVAALDGLMWRASWANRGDRDFLRAHRAEIRVPRGAVRDGAVTVLLEHGALRGFAAVLDLPDAVREIGGMFIEPDHARRGLGRRLLARVIADARGCGALALEVDANPHARGFYLSAGFARLGATATAGGRAERMRLDLSPGGADAS